MLSFATLPTGRLFIITIFGPAGGSSIRGHAGDLLGEGRRTRSQIAGFGVGPYVGLDPVQLG